MRTNKEIINYLNKLKSEQHLSISEIARRVGMAKSAVSRYFNFSREFPLNRVDQFAKAFHVSSEDILGIEKDADILLFTTSWMHPVSTKFIHTLKHN